MRLAFAFILFLFAGALQAQVSIESPFLGTWDNMNRNTREITRMEITQVGAQLKLHLWFAARPVPADAGIFDVQMFTQGARAPDDFLYTGPLLRLQRAIGGTTEEILIERGGTGRLKVQLLRLGGPNGGRVERMVMAPSTTRTTDCVSYDPATLRVSGNVIYAGNAALIDFPDARDRDLGMSLARSFAKLCTIGRGNSRADRNRYILEYWEGGAEGATSPNSDCIGYDPARLRVTNVGADGFRLESVSAAGANYLFVFDTLADANAGLTVFRRHRQQCFIARGSPDVRSYLK